MLVTGAVGLAAYKVLKRRLVRERPFIGLTGIECAMAPFALLVAMSRVVLGLHCPTDVLAGAMLGARLAGASLSMAA